MPRFEKGSKEAKEWADKMRKAREAKKGMKGGMIDEGSDDELAELTSNMSMTDKSHEVGRPSVVNVPKVKPVIKRRTPPLPVFEKPKTPPAEPKKRLAQEQITKGKGMKGGYLQPGEVPLSSTNEALIASKEIEAPLEMSAEQFITDDQIDGMGMCNCKCEMCGGKINLRKGLTKVGKSFGKVGEALNPMSYALKNKSTRNAMVASGDVTQNYALPAVTTAGLPLYYGAAGTAGMLVGGPLGAMAATKAADELYKGMVVKPGYNPQERQKSKTLGVVSSELGKVGAKNLKQGASGKGMRKSKKKKLVIIEE